MNTMNFDYLTLTFLCTREVDVSWAVNEVLDLLKLDDLWSEFLCVGRDRFYPYVFRHNDISVLVCGDGRLKKQGICVRMSGNGLAFYQAHLARKGETLRRVLRAWRAASVNGVFTRCTRVDVAADDIHKNDEAPLLTMQKIRNCVKNREFRSRLQAERKLKRCVMDISEDFSDVGDEEKGKTIYFGNRKSNLCCRFYDKLLEQRTYGDPVDGDVTSWIRCEFEFKDARAMAVINAYCDMSDEDFNKYMAEVFNNYICFIKKNDINRSRCDIKRWWSEFIGTVKRSRLVIPKFKPSTFSGSSDWFKTSIFPSLYAFIECVGLRAFLLMLRKFGRDRLGPRHKQMIKDFVYQFTHQNPSLTDDEQFKNSCHQLGLDVWCMTSKKSKYQAMRDMQEDYKRFRTVNGLEWKEFTDKPDKGVQLAMCGNRSVYVDDEWYEAFCNGM